MALEMADHQDKERVRHRHGRRCRGGNFRRTNQRTPVLSARIPHGNLRSGTNGILWEWHVVAHVAGCLQNLRLWRLAHGVNGIRLETAVKAVAEACKVIATVEEIFAIPCKGSTMLSAIPIGVRTKFPDSFKIDRSISRQRIPR
jgi:hypothetical protein